MDEANAVLGMVEQLGDWPDIDKIIARVQNDMFDLGADHHWMPSCPMSRCARGAGRSCSTSTTTRLQPLTSFILPGGSPATQFLSRTVVRRAERLR